MVWSSVTYSGGASWEETTFSGGGSWDDLTFSGGQDWTTTLSGHPGYGRYLLHENTGAPFDKIGEATTARGLAVRHQLAEPIINMDRGRTTWRAVCRQTSLWEEITYSG